MAGRQKRSSRKHGANKPFCERYRNTGKHEKSQARQLARHLERYPGDGHARAIYDALPEWAKRARKEAA